MRFPARKQKLQIPLSFRFTNSRPVRGTSTEQDKVETVEVIYLELWCDS